MAKLSQLCQLEARLVPQWPFPAGSPVVPTRVVEVDMPARPSYKRATLHVGYESGQGTAVTFWPGTEWATLSTWEQIASQSDKRSYSNTPLL